MHRYLPPGVEEGTPSHDNLSQPLSVDGPGVASNESEGVDTSPFEKFDPLLHIGVARSSARETRSTAKAKKYEILNITFVKKYIQYAKSKASPVLTKGAADHIVQVYATLRNDDMEGNQKKVRSIVLFAGLILIFDGQTSPLTARTLETLIRLATAHAKSRLSTKVQEADAKEAEAIMRFALFKEVPKRQRRKKRKLNSGGAARGKGEDGEQESDDETDEETGDERDAAQRTSVAPDPQVATRARSKSVANQETQDPIWGEDSQDVRMDVEQPPAAAEPTDDGKIRPDR